MVSFSGMDNFTKMESLSGGQKTIIAVTFVFAIQSIINLPFHLFDELDRNLDAHNRAALAAFVKKQVDEKRRQYLFVTHYPEFVDVADKIHGVRFRNGVSSSLFVLPFNFFSLFNLFLL